MVYIAYLRIYPQGFKIFTPVAYPRILGMPILTFYTKYFTQKALRFYPCRLSQNSSANSQLAIDQSICRVYRYTQELFTVKTATKYLL